MLLPCLTVLFGLAVLIWSAEHLIDTAAALAEHHAMPAFLLGILVVGLGTSAPELVVAISAAMQGNPALALGNAWGANILNIAVIVGTSALLWPMTVQSTGLRKEVLALLGVTALSGGLIWDGQISRLDACVLLLTSVALLAGALMQGARTPTAAASIPAPRQAAEPAIGQMTAPGRAWLWLLLSLTLLVLSSRALVWGAVMIAQSLGMSEAMIGLTVLAAGTSLPELAACLAAARKGQADMALGNVIGSNLFNTLVVVGAAAAIAPIAVDAHLITRELPLMAGLTLALALMLWGFAPQPGRIRAWQAAALLGTYLAYLVWSFTTL